MAFLTSAVRFLCREFDAKRLMGRVDAADNWPKSDGLPSVAPSAAGLAEARSIPGADQHSLGDLAGAADVPGRRRTFSGRTASRACRPRLTGMVPILPPANPGRGSSLGARSGLPGLALRGQRLTRALPSQMLQTCCSSAGMA